MRLQERLLVRLHLPGYLGTSVFPGAGLGATEEGHQLQFITDMIGAQIGGAWAETGLEEDLLDAMGNLTAKLRGFAGRSGCEEHRLIGEDVEAEDVVVNGSRIIRMERIG